MKRVAFFVAVSLCFFAGPGYAELNPLMHTSTRYQKVEVEQVLTPDTIQLKGGERIKMIGLTGTRPPKREYAERDEHGFIIKKEVDPATTLEESCFKFVRDLLEGKMVRLEFDAERRDDEGTLQAYVFLVRKDELLANAEILREGAANLRIAPPNVKYADQLRAAYQEARREMRGIQAQW